MQFFLIKIYLNNSQLLIACRKAFSAIGITLSIKKPNAKKQTSTSRIQEKRDGI